MGAPFVWFDLTTAAAGEGVRDFYSRLFGWTLGPGMGDYENMMFDRDQPWAGITPAGATPVAGRWIPYVVVDDLDAATKEATALGGTVVRDRTTGPAGSSVMVADPAGAVIAPTAA